MLLTLYSSIEKLSLASISNLSVCLGGGIKLTRTVITIWIPFKELHHFLQFFLRYTHWVQEEGTATNCDSGSHCSAVVWQNAGEVTYGSKTDKKKHTDPDSNSAF